MRNPTLEWQFYDVLQHRAPLNTEDQHRWYAINRGFEGECKIDQLVAAYPRVSAYWYPNVWLSPRGPQLDALLLTPHVLYIFEIKHYSGHFHYHPEHSTLQGKPFFTNILSQLYYEADSLRRLLYTHNLPPIEIRPYIVFADSSLTFETEKASWRSRCLTYSEFQDLLHNCAFSHHDAPHQKTQQLLAHLSNQETIIPRQLGTLEIEHLTKGPLCPQCHQSHFSYSRWYATCLNCHYRERRSHHYLRTICEYGVLYHHEPLRRKPLLAFLGPTISPWTLTRLLSQHFSPTRASRYTHYKNPRCQIKYRTPSLT